MVTINILAEFFPTGNRTVQLYFDSKQNEIIMLTNCVEKLAGVAMRTVSTSTSPNTCQTTIYKKQAPLRIDVFLGLVQFLSLFQSNVLMKQSPVSRFRPDTLSLKIIVFQ